MAWPGRRLDVRGLWCRLSRGLGLAVSSVFGQVGVEKNAGLVRIVPADRFGQAFLAAAPGGIKGVLLGKPGQKPLVRVQALVVGADLPQMGQEPVSRRQRDGFAQGGDVAYFCAQRVVFLVQRIDHAGQFLELLAVFTPVTA